MAAPERRITHEEKAVSAAGADGRPVCLCGACGMRKGRGSPLRFLADQDEYENSNYDMDSLSKYSKWYCHVELCGGKPGDKTKVKLVATYPDGSTVSRWWDWELVRGDTSWWCFYYNTPQYGSTGTFSIKFYDENSNLIGKDSVQITG